MVRQLQFIEHEVKRKSEARKTHDGSEFFLGRHRRTGGAIISPELLEWVAAKTARESSILKEQRKIADERKLQRPAKGKDKNHQE